MAAGSSHSDCGNAVLAATIIYQQGGSYHRLSAVVEVTQHHRRCYSGLR